MGSSHLFTATQCELARYLQMLRKIKNSTPRPWQTVTKLKFMLSTTSVLCKCKSTFGGDCRQMFPRCPDFECFSSIKRVLVGSIAVLLLMWWSEGLQVSLRMPEKVEVLPAPLQWWGNVCDVAPSLDRRWDWENLVTGLNPRSCSQREPPWPVGPGADSSSRPPFFVIDKCPAMAAVTSVVFRSRRMPTCSPSCPASTPPAGPCRAF